MASFSWCVRTAKSGAETYQIHLRVHTADNAAFKACVAHLYGGFFSEEFTVYFYHAVGDGTVEIRLPCTVLSTVFHLHTGHVETAGLHFLDVLHHGVAAAAGQYQHLCLTGTYLYDSQVAAGLHYRGDAGDVA